MIVKGAFHLHSTFSRDGEVSLADIKRMFMGDGFHFVALAEHQHDMDQSSFDALVAECRGLSDPGFLMIPGIEFNCYRNHILGLGIAAYCPSVAGDDVVPWIKGHQGFAVWAHPKKNDYRLPHHVVEALDGMEIWNSKFDGKYAPRPDVVRYYCERLAHHPRLRPFLSVDFHFRSQFRHVPMYCEVDHLSTEEVLASLRAGTYVGKTTAFSVSGHGCVEGNGHALRRLVNKTNLWVFDRCKRLYRGMKRRQLVLPAGVKNLGRRIFS
ncbi:MAG TPA: hypothetical protein VHF07_09420 [Nitrospiraceae bacterium]|nr:hypothetical protein [Nitrospiraceae bacterium]